MAFIKTYPFQNSTILRINSERDIINTNPEYQRNGGVWNKEKKQLLIDSIINDYDIPKLYFHALSKDQLEQSNSEFEFAIIDGRQRLETIWSFIDGEFGIAEDFVYFQDPSMDPSGLTYIDLARNFPKLKIRFDSYILPIILVETEDLDLIEDMFSRLNEAVPLNAAEKRNAIGGSMAGVIRNTALHPFFTEKVSFNNNRYQHREVAARLLFLMYSLTTKERIADTKKIFLDKMVHHYKDNTNEDPNLIRDLVTPLLDRMCEVFADRDNLLRSQGSITIYFMLFKLGVENQTVNRITRASITRFYEDLRTNRSLAEEDITDANYELLEFERMSQQGTNDAYSIMERTEIMARQIGVLSP